MPHSSECIARIEDAGMPSPTGIEKMQQVNEPFKKCIDRERKASYYEARRGGPASPARWRSIAPTTWMHR
jgi:hypothetical protein